MGRLRVSERGRDDPLEPADLELLRSLAGEVGPAVQAVRLHQDLLRSRAEVVALREDERRRLRRDLHDGLGPSLAAIGLKAGLAARQVPPESAARGLLGEIDTEVKAGLGDIRRLVEALRPPALDELGLVGAVRARAASLAGDVIIDVSGPEHDRSVARGGRDRGVPDRGRGADQRGPAQRRCLACRVVIMVSAETEARGVRTRRRWCHRLVRSMGGELKVESTPGHGSRFYFELPLVIADEPPLVAAEAGAESLSSDARLAPGEHLTVLVADDSSVNRRILASLLESAAVRVITAAGGVEAVDLAPRQSSRRRC